MYIIYKAEGAFKTGLFSGGAVNGTRVKRIMIAS